MWDVWDVWDIGNMIVFCWFGIDMNIGFFFCVVIVIMLFYERKV